MTKDQKLQRHLVNILETGYGIYCRTVHVPSVVAKTFQLEQSYLGGAITAARIMAGGFESANSVTRLADLITKAAKQRERLAAKRKWTYTTKGKT